MGGGTLRWPSREGGTQGRRHAPARPPISVGDIPQRSTEGAASSMVSRPNAFSSFLSDFLDLKLGVSGGVTRSVPFTVVTEKFVVFY